MIISELFTSLPKRDSVFWHNIGIEIKLQSLFFVRVLVNGRIPYKQTFAESLSLLIEIHYNLYPQGDYNSVFVSFMYLSKYNKTDL